MSFYFYRNNTNHMWHKFPLLSCYSPAHTQGGHDCWGIFVPSNSRHSVGLNFSLQFLSSDPLTLCFHEFWNKGPANTDCICHQLITASTTGSKSNEFLLQICVPVLSPYLDSPMSYIAQVLANPFTEAVLLHPWGFSTARHG